MALDVAGSVAANVDVGCDDAAAVATHNLKHSQLLVVGGCQLLTYLHGDASSPLHTAANICAVPCHAEWNLWVDTDCGKDCTSVLHVGLLSSSKHREAGDGNELEAQHEDASLAHSICVPAGSDGEEAGAYVRRNGH